MPLTETAAGRYQRLCRAIAGHPLPLALVELDALEANIDRVLAPIIAAGKKLRIATKSIRCPDLLARIVARSGPHLAGLMCYAAAEAQQLAALGYRDLILAYPTAQASDLEILARLATQGVRAAVVADDEAQLAPLERAAEAQHTRVPVILEVDCSLRPLQGALHLGVRRSPLHDPASVLRLAERVHRSPHLALAGVMGYEAQIAGLTDRSPHHRGLNLAKRALKQLSRRPVAELRAEIAAGLAARDLPCPIFNGGGTGSLAWSAAEPALTELTAGSGFLAGRLFSEYRQLHLEPAALFALQVVRRPGPGIITCHGGGYVASGEAGPDRLPVPYLPEGLALLPREGAGEVQTPLSHRPGPAPELGAPVFFRHAKSGELAEHFDRYHMVRDDRLEGQALTYRGQRWSFLG